MEKRKVLITLSLVFLHISFEDFEWRVQCLLPLTYGCLGTKEKGRIDGQGKGDVLLSSRDLQQWLGTIKSWAAVWTVKPLRQNDEGRKRCHQGVVIDIHPYKSVNAFLAAFPHISIYQQQRGDERGCCVGDGGRININLRTDWRQHSSEVAHDDVSWATPTHCSRHEWKGERREERTQDMFPSFIRCKSNAVFHHRNLPKHSGVIIHLLYVWLAHKLMHPSEATCISQHIQAETMQFNVS